MNTLGLRFVAAIALLCVCTAQAHYSTIKLDRRTSVKILGLGPLYFSQGPPALMLRYQSGVDFSDKRALHKEALGIWKSFRVEVEQDKFQVAILSANSPPSGGIISHSQGYNFVFEKQGRIWRETGDAAKL